MPGVEPLRLKPIFKERVWGGDRLDPQASNPVGEAWVVYEGNEIAGGTWAGHSLGAIAEEFGEQLLGEPVVRKTGRRFPLLIKLLDSRDWLSVQVHPDDEQARRLEGPGHFGKTEAWHILEANVDAQLIYGLRDDVPCSEIEHLARSPNFEQALNFLPASPGDTFFTPAGCVHAIGPGLLIYEVQQTSDITYRLYDWNRPLQAGRELHLDKGPAVIGSCHQGGAIGLTTHAQGPTLVECPYFALDRISSERSSLTLSTEERSFHALTLIGGSVAIQVGEMSMPLVALETLIVPAAAGHYDVVPVTPFAALVSRVP